MLTCICSGCIPFACHLAREAAPLKAAFVFLQAVTAQSLDVC